jgi:DHA2 family multidrug resistance protein
LVARRQQFHQQRLLENLNPMNQTYQSFLSNAQHLFMSKGSDAVHAMAQAQQLLYGMVQRQAILLSFIENFRMLAIAFLCVIPLMFFMKTGKPKKGEVVME